MKLTLLSVWLCLVALSALSQSVFRLDSLPQQGVLLDKGWRWHLGDNSAWAKPDFDDSRWDTLNPVLSTAKMHQLPHQGIGWLRIRLKVSPQLWGKQVGLTISQAGATETFLNHKLLVWNGTISPQKDVAIGSFFALNSTITLDADSIQVIAVRYAFLRNQLLANRLPYSFFDLQLTPPELAEKSATKSDVKVSVEFALFGVFLVLGLLQLLLRINSAKQPAVVSLSLFLTTQGVVHLINGIFTSDTIPALLGITSSLIAFDSAYAVFATLIPLSSFFYLLGTYQYFGQPKKTLFWVVAAITLLSIPAILLLELIYGALAQFIPAILIPFSEILRVGVVAMRRNRPGARLFTLAHGITLFVFVVWTVSQFLPTVSSFLAKNGLYLFSVSFLGLALTISLLLAHERAGINKLLRQQLLDLDALSQKTIAQEQEKQQLLTNQNERLEQQVESRTIELNQSLTELKTTQAQLIQKEKLASLGELTAGIAHEIQNPLNFVNNFSEVSAEMVDELTEDQQNPEPDPTLQAELLTDLKDNLHKILHHGKRASNIVRGMLEHSRTSSGEVQPTDLNALADEYLKLAYHGLRAKDKNGSTGRFNAELVTDFAPNLGKVNVVAQDVGRVLLNLFNNAFYAVHQKQQQTPADYYPTVTVTTRVILHSPERVPSLTQSAGLGMEYIEIRVTDNGTGIPESVKAKIFQPFFTTKPTGEGTGLGLSLSYDIVTKGHGGSLEVLTQEGQGTEFIIHLPISAKEGVTA